VLGPHGGVVGWVANAAGGQLVQEYCWSLEIFWTPKLLIDRCECAVAVHTFLLFG
jgi:hypothetical protein